jgi:chromosome segregation ATPase
MDDSNRRTGRTTRMIEVAKAAEAAGERVLIIGHSVGYARGLAEQVGPSVKFASPDDAHRSMIGSCAVGIIDHYAVEVWTTLVDQQRKRAARAEADLARAHTVMAEQAARLHSAEQTNMVLRMDLRETAKALDEARAQLADARAELSEARPLEWSP